MRANAGGVIFDLVASVEIGIFGLHGNRRGDQIKNAVYPAIFPSKEKLPSSRTIACRGYCTANTAYLKLIV